MITSIQQATCAYFGITLEEMLGNTRGPLVVAAKHIARYLEHTAGRSYHEIATLYGLADHTSALASYNHTAARLAASDAGYIGPVGAISAVVDLQREKTRVEASKTIESIACPTCGAPVIRELQRQIAEMREQMNEMRGIK